MKELSSSIVSIILLFTCSCDNKNRHTTPKEDSMRLHSFWDSTIKSQIREDNREKAIYSKECEKLLAVRNRVFERVIKENFATDMFTKERGMVLTETVDDCNQNTEISILKGSINIKNIIQKGASDKIDKMERHFEVKTLFNFFSNEMVQKYGEEKGISNNYYFGGKWYLLDKNGVYYEGKLNRNINEERKIACGKYKPRNLIEDFELQSSDSNEVKKNITLPFKNNSKIQAVITFKIGDDCLPYKIVYIFLASNFDNELTDLRYYPEAESSKIPFAMDTILYKQISTFAIRVDSK